MIDLPVLVADKGVVRRWLAPSLSAVILIAAVWQLRGLDLTMVVRALPSAPLFWLVFVTAYLVTPASEWLIYRRLWRLPASGFFALLRKRVSNEIVVGYSGDLYFYGWARRRAHLTGAPFGAIKDVAILSAGVANLCTLALVAFCWPLLANLPFATDRIVLATSIAAIGLPSVAARVFRRRLFALDYDNLAIIAGIHFARVVVTTILSACIWALALPSAPLVWWLVLATLRLLVSRLPLLPNKDIIFAGMVAFAIGETAGVTAMLTMLAGLLLATHLLLGAVLGLADLIFTGRTA